LPEAGQPDAAPQQQQDRETMGAAEWDNDAWKTAWTAAMLRGNLAGSCSTLLPTAARMDALNVLAVRPGGQE